MRKTNLIQLTVVALLLLGINSQAANATLVFADVPVVAYEEETTPAVIAATDPVKEFNGFLPSLDGDVAGTYANYSAGDDPADRYNAGQLTNSSAEHSFAYPIITGPLHGVFITELYWNGSIAGDIDLYPGWVNSTGFLKTGYPAGVSEMRGDYYSGANPEYIYMEIDLAVDENATIASHIWAYDNDVIDFYVNATYIDYDVYMSSIGYLVNPIPEIVKPIEGEVFAVSDLLHDPQRYVPLNHTYTAGTEAAWVSEVYDFSSQDAIPTFDGGSWLIELTLNGEDLGYAGGAGEVKMGLAAGEYQLVYLATSGGVILGSTNVNFTVAGIELGAGTVAMTNTTFTINQAFVDPTVTAADQLGSALDSVTLWYFDQGTGNVWHEVDMTLAAGIWTYEITGLINTTNVHYYFVVEDGYGVVFDFYKFDNEIVQYVFEGIVETATETESPGFLIPLAIVSLGLMAIVRRRN